MEYNYNVLYQILLSHLMAPLKVCVPQPPVWEPLLCHPCLYKRGIFKTIWNSHEVFSITYFSSNSCSVNFITQPHFSGPDSTLNNKSCCPSCWELNVPIIGLVEGHERGRGAQWPPNLAPYDCPFKPNAMVVKLLWILLVFLTCILSCSHVGLWLNKITDTLSLNDLRTAAQVLFSYSLSGLFLR